MTMPVKHPDREDVMAYLDGELTADHESDVRAHLEGCDTCSSFAEELKAVSRQLAAWKPEPVPETLDQRVEGEVQAAARSRSRKTSRGRQLLAWQIPRWQLAGAVALVAIVILVSQPQLRQAPAGRVTVNQEPVRPAEET